MAAMETEKTSSHSVNQTDDTAKDDEEYLKKADLKIILLGDSAVGKSKYVLFFVFDCLEANIFI